MPHKAESNDSTFISNKVGDRFIPEIVSPAISQFDYQEIWRKRYGPLELTSEHTYIFIGTDSGLLIKAFAENTKDHPLALVFIEDDRYLDAVANECQAVLNSMPFVELVTLEQFREKLDNFGYDQALLTGRISTIKASCAENDELEAITLFKTRPIFYWIPDVGWLLAPL